MAGRIGEMQALVAHQSGEVQAETPVAGWGFGQASDGMPINIDQAFALAAADQHLEALNREEQLKGLDPVDRDAQRVVMTEVVELGPVLALDGGDPLMFPIAVDVGLGTLAPFEPDKTLQRFPA